MSSAAAATAKSTRGPKTRGTEWWEPPPDTPLNLAIPYVVSIVDDGLSLAQSRVLAALTDMRDGAKRAGGDECPERGFLCDPGGYTRIARKTGLCRKTVYNAVHSLIAKGVLRVWKVLMKGMQRVKTMYFALHYADILPAWRADKRWFHTAHKDSVVVRKRSKQFVTKDEAAEWKMDAKRAPKRGSGRGLIEVEQAYTPAPEGVIALPAAPALSDEDLAAVHMEMLRQTGASCLQDAIDIIAAARAEAKSMGYEDLGYGGPLPCLTIAELVRAAGERYTPKRRPTSTGYEIEHPRPTPGWFLGGQIRREVARHLKFDWEQKQG